MDIAWTSELGDSVAEEALVVLEPAELVNMSLWVTSVAGRDQRSSLKGGDE